MILKRAFLKCMNECQTSELKDALFAPQVCLNVKHEI